jgi:hypothetical protein
MPEEPKFVGTQWVYEGAPGFSPHADALGQNFPALVFDSQDHPYVGFNNLDNGSCMAVMKFDGTSWQFVGGQGFTSANANWPRLAFDSNDVLYAAYGEAIGTFKVSVMTFNGQGWNYVGGGPIMTGVTPSIAVNGDNVPYVSFRENVPAGTDLSVIKYNGTAWVYAGNPKFFMAGDHTLRFNTSNRPVVANMYYENGQRKISVMTLLEDNGVWTQVGDPSQFPTEGQLMTFDAGPGNTLYLAFEDWVFSSSGRVSVMRFNGLQWAFVGARGFSPLAWNSMPFVSVSPQGQPYVFFREYNQTYRVSVMKYVDASIGGDAPVSAVAPDLPAE